jgi:broad specificity phosphatase PhoE
MALLLVRHGETVWNLEGRYQGRLDSPLTQQGVAQADSIGRLVSQLPEFSAAEIVSSPLGRAYRTAEIICSHRSRPSFRTDDRLQEISIGSWDGLTRHDIDRMYPGMRDGDGRFEWYFQSPDGESYDAFACRISAWLSEQPEDRPLVVITHGVVGRVLRGIYAGLPRRIAISLPAPQDKVYRLSGGLIEEISVPLNTAGVHG